ncbi:MAG: hypothetical protein IID45_01725 [Planctomycetes bacterium]|nr:hypothetical protein [Planctomycetota bacterium]
MNAEQSDEILSAYLDDEVSDEERAAVEIRLQTSAEESRLLREMQQLSQELRDLPADELPDDFPRSVLRAVQGDSLRAETNEGGFKRPAAATGSSWRGLIVLASTVAALLLMLPVLQLRDSSQRDSGESANRHADARRSETTPLADGPESLASRSSSRTDKSGFMAGKPPGAKTPGSGVLPSKTDKAEGIGNKLRSALEKADNGSVAGVGGAGKLNRRSGKIAGMRGGSADDNSHSGLVPPIDVANGNNPQGSRSGESRLVFIDDLQKLSQRDVGRVVTAFETTDAGVVVVKLTVVDCRAGLESLQILLTRNEIQLQPDAERLHLQIPNKKSTAYLPAVFVQATRRQLVSAVLELREDNAFRTLQVERPISLARLDAVSRRQLQSMEQMDALVEAGGKNQSSHAGKRASVGTSKMKGLTIGRFAKNRNLPSVAPGSRSQKRTLTQSSNRKPFDRKPFDRKKDLRRKMPPLTSSPIAELQRISKQLRLSLPADVLRAESSTYPNIQQRQLAVRRKRDNQPKRLLKSAAPLPRANVADRSRRLRVLFVLENCRSSKTVPARPRATPARSRTPRKSLGKRNGNGSA